jgi:hypothetical protein
MNESLHVRWQHRDESLSLTVLDTHSRAYIHFHAAIPEKHAAHVISHTRGLQRAARIGRGLAFVC